MQILFLGLHVVGLGATATEVMATEVMATEVMAGRASQMSKVDARIMAMLKQNKNCILRNYNVNHG